MPIALAVVCDAIKWMVVSILCSFIGIFPALDSRDVGVAGLVVLRPDGNGGKPRLVIVLGVLLQTKSFL